MSLTQPNSTRAFIALWIFSLTLYSKAWHDLKLRKPQIHTNTVEWIFICICDLQKCISSPFYLSKTISHENNGKSGAFLLEITNIIIKSLKSFYHQLELSEIKKKCFVAFHSNSYGQRKKIKFSGCSFYFLKFQFKVN